MSKTGEWLACLLLVSAAPARAESPTSLEQLSPVERQQSDFYGAIAGNGPSVAVTWTLAPAKATHGGDITLTLLVKNAVNPSELARPDLANRPEWKELFSAIRDTPGAAPGEFQYVLTPRNTGRWELPVPKYRYYDPRPPEGRRFLLAFAEGPTLLVEPAPVAGSGFRVPLEAPADFFDDPPSSHRASSAPPTAYWCALLAVAVAGPAVWILVWHWRNPDAARLAQIRRAKAVRAALDALRRAERSGDPREAVPGITLRYLRERWHLPDSARTPREVGDALGDGERVRETVALLARCDRARFDRFDDNGMTLAGEARSLIERWEGLAT